MAKSEQITYHVTTSQTWFQNRSQIFLSGTRSAHFESEKKPLSLLFLTSEKSLPVPETKIWDLFWIQVCDVVTWYVICSLLAIGKWFSRFFSFYIGLFLILCTWENSSFAKEEGLHHKMYKIKLFHCCDVVPNPVVEIENFNFHN